MTGDSKAAEAEPQPDPTSSGATSGALGSRTLLPWWTVRTLGVALRRQNPHPPNPTSEWPVTPSVPARSVSPLEGQGEAKPAPASRALPAAAAACAGAAPGNTSPAAHLSSPLEHFLSTDQHILGLSHSNPGPSPLLLHEASPPTQHPQPEAPSVHLPSPRAGKARPVSLRNWPLEAQPGWRTTVVRTQSWASTLPSPGSNEPPSTGETGENSVGK